MIVSRIKIFAHAATGIASNIPYRPATLAPASTATKIETGPRLVARPAKTGVRRYPSIDCTIVKTSGGPPTIQYHAIRSASGIVSWFAAKSAIAGMITTNPRYGTIERIPASKPRVNAYGTPLIHQPPANITPIPAAIRILPRTKPATAASISPAK